MLEVQFALVLRVVLDRYEAVEPAEPGRVFAAFFLDLLQKAQGGIALHRLGHRLSQLLGELDAAIGAVEVEEDVGQPHGDETALRDPDVDLLAPLAARFPPKRIHGHDVAFAKRKTDRIELVVHPLCELAEIAVDLVVVVIWIVFQDEAVVLVRIDEVLAATA